jgi:pimeloyl-ACP methyl ester carboxylesterase
MFAFLTKALDRLAIRMACSSLGDGTAAAPRLAEAEALLRGPDYFCNFVSAPADLTFRGRKEFRFRSPIATPWLDNNVVLGRLDRAGHDWRQRPSVVLLHGWNGERACRWLFPALAWRLNRMGINVAMIELPYHGGRTPRAAGAPRNFISHDLRHTVEAARQALADTRSLVAWLRAQGSTSVSLWGVSLGAWLAGLIVCHDPLVRSAVLLTPVARMDRVVQELEFCEPIRRGLGNAVVPWSPLNLASHSPLGGPERVLIVESQHDLFAPAETIEELWRAWDQPEIWRLPHGHISVLMSVPTMERTVKWLAAKANNLAERLLAQPTTASRAT